MVALGRKSLVNHTFSCSGDFSIKYQQIKKHLKLMYLYGSELTVSLGV